ncbi:acyl-CoA dehydrogenase family protein [Sphingomonas sp. LY29]|uniref:acyl-CoA dehydrogenase family protein n=1 Tax=Sphingomonas sp. LY29 TaxID=3095341 RepID=UPI002D76C432|nr:acyl-CoA dehydrogenase family protein [Sphingomonas sp. LY29]WRP26920.1 acyl-CoA dehydrogenase family protein [Sphingomonas sp. LY29]
MTDWLDWPFFEEPHRGLSERLDAWCKGRAFPHGADIDAACRELVAELGKADFLSLCVGGERTPDVRSLAIARATLAYHSGLADFAFAMQGLGSGAISLAGDEAQKAEWLPKVANGSAIAAFAMTEPETGSDAANVAMTARHDGNGYRLDGEKTYISNGGIADLYTVIARTGEAEGARGLSMFIVRGDDPGLSVAERIEVVAPHPLARLRFDGVRGELIGTSGDGFGIAMRTLNLFRVTVGAAALGFARRALDEAVRFASMRKLGNATLADNAVTQDRLGDMATAIDASALLIARAGWAQDRGAGDNRRAAAMAKLHATEEAGRVIDLAVQMHGGLGVTVGATVESLYREIRALRIYEGASEVQRMIIARDLLKERRA